MNHREILLYGFHFSFFLVFTLAVLRDLYLNHYFNASINFTTLTLSFFSYYIVHYKHKLIYSSYLIIIIAVIPLFILIYFNNFENLVVVYVILLPILSFFLLKFKQAIAVNSVIYISLIIMLYLLYVENPTTPILSNHLALFNITFASIFIMFFGIFYQLAIDSSLSALIHSNRQKDILLQEVHHRVKNNLNVISSILGLQSIGKNSETKEELIRTKARIESIAMVHEMLYKQDDYEKINFFLYVEKLQKLILSMQEKPASIIVHDNPMSLSLNIMIQFGLIINELLTNSLKYASNMNGLKISISLKREEDTFLFIYKDNGEFFLSQELLESSSGLGFRLISLSVKQLDGRLEKYYNNGLIYKIRFQKNA